MREVATTSSEVILTDLMAGNFISGTTLKTRLGLHDQLIGNLKDIGASDSQIEKADKMWKKGISITFHRGIHKALEGSEHPNKINIKPEPHVLEASKEFQNLLKFEEWKAPSPDSLRIFIEERNVMNPFVDELLKDYLEFEQTGIFRRKGVFVQL